MGIKSTINGLLGRPVTIPWDVFFKRIYGEYSIYEVNPTSSIRNNQTYVLAKVIASLYQKPSSLREWFRDGTLLTSKSPYRVNYRIIMRENDIGFYFLIPADREAEILRKIEGVYDTNLTINKVESLPKLEASRCFCTEINYKKHPLFSLDTDRTNNYPLPSLLTAVRTLEGQDCAVFDAMFQPENCAAWWKEARYAHTLLEKGYVPDNSPGGRILRAVHQGFNAARYEILELTRLTAEQKSQFEKWKQEDGSFREARRIRREMSHETKRKQDEDVLKAWLRVAVESDNIGRAQAAAYTIANSFKDLNQDNEVDKYDVPKKFTTKYVDAIENRKAFSIRLQPMKVSTFEAGKFIQLPGDTLIKEFPEIRAQKLKEVRLPDELRRHDIKTVRIGWVTERGNKILARIPLEAYDDIKLKHVYDALCTATYAQGKMGSGKTDGCGANWAYDMITNGFTAVIIDTADGQGLRNLINALPADYPDDHIHALSIDNKSYPIALNWDDVYGRTFAGSDDAELQALEISERITARFTDFINSLSNTGEFTDRMALYVTSCMRAITTQPGWCFLDLELALTSPSYREELLSRTEVQVLPDVVRDLNSLQEKAANDSDSALIDPILSRIRTLSSTQFMTNLFYQRPKKDTDGKPALDIRKLLDNEDGGKYGHIIAVHASVDAWGANQSTILGFFLDKIIFNAFSRVDQEQDLRKPCLLWIDEPHKVIRNVEGRLVGTSVEFRKYRVKNLFTGHSIDQMGSAAASLLDGGTQITSYKTERLSELQRFAHQFAPYDDAKTLYEALPDKWRAVNSVRLPSGKHCPAFLADMLAPPRFVKDRSYIWQKCSEKYGRSWKEVRDEIQERRTMYQELDHEWRSLKRDEGRKRKAEEAQALKEAKDALKNQK